jgi:phosphate uptake regulator
MRRKIIRQGNNSYTITLPIDWIRDEELKEGSEVEIEREDSHLNIFLTKDARRIQNKISLDLKDYNNRTIINILNQTYRKGYDIITLNYHNNDQLLCIKENIKELFGFEIVDIKNNECILQNIAEPSAEKFDVILRKVFLIIKEGSNEILNDLKDNKSDKSKKLDEEKKTFDNYTNLCRRLIIRDRIGGTKDSYSLLIIVSRLSLIYHAYYYMYKAIANKKISLNKETQNLFSETNKMFELFESAFYNKDFEKANKIGILKDKLLYSNLYSLLKKSNGEENIVLYHVGEIIRLIHLASINLFGFVKGEENS